MIDTGLPPKRKKNRGNWKIEQKSLKNCTYLMVPCLFAKVIYKVQTGLAHDLNPKLDGTKSVVLSLSHLKIYGKMKMTHFLILL